MKSNFLGRKAVLGQEINRSCDNSKKKNSAFVKAVKANNANKKELLYNASETEFMTYIRSLSDSERDELKEIYKGDSVLLNRIEIAMYDKNVENKDSNILGTAISVVDSAYMTTIGSFSTMNSILHTKGTLYANEISEDLVKDSAALCQAVYYFSSNGGNKLYHSTSKNWNPLPINGEEGFWWGMVRNLFRNNVDVEDEGTRKIDDVVKCLEKHIVLKKEITGFNSMLFYKESPNSKKTKFVYVTEGTNEKRDWFTANLLQGGTGLSPQYTRSVQNAKLIMSTLDKIYQNEYELYFAGHSLGGGLASNNSIATGKEAYTFDAAGLNFLRTNVSTLWNRPSDIFAINERRSRIHAYIYKGELLNGILSRLPSIFEQSAYGKKTIIKNRLNKNTLDKHGMELICDELFLTPGNKESIKNGI